MAAADTPTSIPSGEDSEPPAIDKLPQELLCSIFKLSIDESPHATAALDGVCTGFRQRVPWSLGAICQGWRETVLGYPAFWNTLLVLPTSDPATLAEQLRRAGNTSPLRVCFDWFNIHRAPIPPSIPPSLLPLVLPTSERWAGLQLRNLYWDLSSVENEWLATLAGKLTMLERLEIFKCGSWRPPADLFTTARRLTYALTVAADESDVSPPVQLPWPQITHYRGALHSQDQLTHLLDAQNLIECVLGSGGLLDEALFEQVCLPRLRKLHLTSGHLLGCITAPVLEELYLWSEDGGLEDSEFGTLVPFLKRSDYTLRSLGLFNCRFASAFVAAVFLVLPTLEELLLESPRAGYERGMLDALRPRHDANNALFVSEYPLPSLRQLVYGYRYISTASDAVFTVVKARCRTMSRFLLYRADTADAKPDSRISELQNIGVEAEVVRSDHPEIREKLWGNF